MNGAPTAHKAEFPTQPTYKENFLLECISRSSLANPATSIYKETKSLEWILIQDFHLKELKMKKYSSEQFYYSYSSIGLSDQKQTHRASHEKIGLFAKYKKL